MVMQVLQPSSDSFSCYLELGIAAGHIIEGSRAYNRRLDLADPHKILKLAGFPRLITVLKDCGLFASQLRQK